MIKTLNNTIKQDRTVYKIPRSVQDVIPIQRIFADGIFQFGTKYSRTLRFSDINYAIASKEDKTAMFLGYSELLNALDSGSTTKLTICNKQVNRQAFEDTVLLPQRGDSLDGFVDEFNGMLESKISGSSASVEQERFITVSVHKKNVDEARTFFSRVTGEVSSKLSRLNSSSNELDAAERLDVLRGFFRPEEAALPFDLQSAMKRGHNLKDTICPDSLEFHRDYFKMGSQYGRVLFLKDYASYIKDSMILELTDLNRRMMLSIDMIPVPTDEAVREVENKLLGVETNVTNWQRRQNSNQNFSAVVPYDLEQQRKETREMLDDLTTRDQRMLFAVVTLVHLADSKEELDSDTETLQSIARKHLCQLAKLSFQQQDGLITALPLGLRRIDALRTLTTEALAVLMPFKAQEIRHRHGIYYGQNAISKNLILADRKELLNGNGFILGVSGSGKSFAAKREITEIALSTNDDITGLRKGEIAALLWSDYDAQTQTIHVTKQYLFYNGQGTVSPPKSSTSVRYVSIPEEAAKLLEQEHEKHPKNPYMFPSPVTGEMYHPDAIVKIHRKICKDIGLERVRFHDLRHSFATTALQCGVDVKTVSTMLGHSSAGFTLNVYTHSTSRMQQEAARTVGKVMPKMLER